MDDTAELTATDKAALRKMLEDAIAKLPKSTTRVDAFAPTPGKPTLWQRIRKVAASLTNKITKGG